MWSCDKDMDFVKNRMNYLIKHERRRFRKLARQLRFCKLLFCILTLGMIILRLSLSYQNDSQHKLNMKYVLLWSPRWAAPISFLELGQTKLLKLKCSVKNCYFTDDRNFFGGDLKNFDVVVFNGMTKEFWFERDMPKQRYSHQKYVFMTMESPENYPLCSPSYDNFFNWTYTYKLDSECVMSYFTILDKDGFKVGPDININWVKPMNEISKRLERKLKRRKKTAAWFVSNCDRAKSGRDDVVKKLQTELDKYHLQVDIYGECGKKRCTNCGQMLESKYFFYLAFENSICEDYVSEKLYRAMHRKVVPIVLGGADYTRFAPPGSYLDARALSPQELASTMHQLVNNLTLYSSFLRWTNHYKYIVGFDNSICDFCELINNENKTGRFSLYENFRKWWHPDFKTRCEKFTKDPKSFISAPLDPFVNMDF